MVTNRLDEPLTVVAQERPDQIKTRGARRPFSDEDARGIRWFYTLRRPDGSECSSSEAGIRHMEQCAAERAHAADSSVQDERSKISPTQPGRQLHVGERLSSPHGTWTVSEARHVPDGPILKFCSYLLTHEDGRQEEWRGRDMAEADFHLILDDQQQTLI
ncbi:hypothetical protein [Streptomyces sp. NPDC088812]|uniref:hypothetical protein n=1 Tax=Streptomyces sp. NPDC088812 TaxID=3365905 RepID=UPI00381DC5E1